MLQNIIAYTGILIAFSIPFYFAWKANGYLKAGNNRSAIKNCIYGILMLIVSGWISNIGQAYHVRSMNEAKKEYENGEACRMDG